MNASVEAIEGSHVSLLCGADSNPLPLLTWMRDGSVLREAVAESLFLDLEEVTPAEDGVYACLAENAYGQDNRTVGLSVMCEWRPRGDEGKPPPAPGLGRSRRTRSWRRSSLRPTHAHLANTCCAPRIPGRGGKAQGSGELGRLRVLRTALAGVGVEPGPGNPHFPVSPVAVVGGRMRGPQTPRIPLSALCTLGSPRRRGWTDKVLCWEPRRGQ